MTVTEIISLCASIGSLFVAFAGAVLAWRRSKPENRYTESNTAKNYQEIADKAAERLDKVQSACDDLEVKINTLEDQLKAANTTIADLQGKLKEANTTIEALQKKLAQALDDVAKHENHARMLANQIRSQFSGTPVTLEYAEKKRLAKGTG